MQQISNTVIAEAIADSFMERTHLAPISILEKNFRQQVAEYNMAEDWIQRKLHRMEERHAMFRAAAA